jgi:hypothetical protein
VIIKYKSGLEHAWGTDALKRCHLRFRKIQAGCANPSFKDGMLPASIGRDMTKSYVWPNVEEWPKSWAAVFEKNC